MQAAVDAIGTGISPSAAVAITVTEVNDPPVATDDPLSSVLEDSGTRLISLATLSGNDSRGPANEGAQTLTVTGVSNPVGGTVLINDNYTVQISATLDSFNILSNDLLTLGDSYSVTLQSPPSSGTLVNHQDGIFSYTAPGTAVGGVNFGYIVCSESCPNLCDTAIVFIEVKQSTNNCEIIPKVITPNGDGDNDTWLVFCLETNLFPGNTMIVFNQWGDKVYEAAPYDNLKGWDGTLNGEAGKDLPDGTYYYIFKPSPTDPPIKGFLTIFR